jgi:hypothetical protein
MASAINDTVPLMPVSFYSDMRANFAAAKAEIEALQTRLIAYEGALVEMLTRDQADRVYAAKNVVVSQETFGAEIAQINRRFDALPPPQDPRYGPLAAEVAQLREDVASLLQALDRYEPPVPPANMRTTLLVPARQPR